MASSSSPPCFTLPSTSTLLPEKKLPCPRQHHPFPSWRSSSNGWQRQRRQSQHLPLAQAPTPELRRVKPENGESGSARAKLVYVVLEAQYQSSLSAAAAALNAECQGAAFEVMGYLLEELGDEETYRSFRRDLEDANIFIGSLIFVEHLALKVTEAVEAERSRMDAVLVFPSMPEVMKMNKLGSFSMSSAIPFFQLFKREGKRPTASFADGMLKLVRTLPKVLKYLPGDKARDVRSYVLGLQFWLGGSPENLKNLMKMVAGSYVPALKGSPEMEFQDPVLFPERGIWHPMAPRMFGDTKEYLSWYRGAGRRDDEAPSIGLILSSLRTWTPPERPSGS